MTNYYKTGATGREEMLDYVYILVFCLANTVTVPHVEFTVHGEMDFRKLPILEFGFKTQNVKHMFDLIAFRTGLLRNLML